MTEVYEGVEMEVDRELVKGLVRRLDREVELRKIVGGPGPRSRESAAGCPRLPLRVGRLRGRPESTESRRLSATGPPCPDGWKVRVVPGVVVTT